MINKETIQKDYTNNCEVYQLILPFKTGILIPDDDSVRLLSQIMEELNYTKLNEAYSSQGRNSAVEPKILFKILIYGYMNDIYSSRKIEKACKRDINFMWLLQGCKAPDHCTIARFRSERLVGVVDDLFNQFVKKLETYGEVEFENIFIDGTKIEANANKYTFVWKKSTEKFRAKLHEKIKKIIGEINSEFKKEYIIPEPKAEVIYLQNILNLLNENKEYNSV